MDTSQSFSYSNNWKLIFSLLLKVLPVYGVLFLDWSVLVFLLYFIVETIAIFTVDYIQLYLHSKRHGCIPRLFKKGFNDPYAALFIVLSVITYILFSNWSPQLTTSAIYIVASVSFISILQILHEYFSTNGYDVIQKEILTRESKKRFLLLLLFGILWSYSTYDINESLPIMMFIITADILLDFTFWKSKKNAA